MKLLFKIAVLSFIFMWGCNKDPFIAELSVSTTELNYTYKGGDSVITISSNADWNITYSSSWCRPSIETANGDLTLTITADINELEEERYAVFTISATGIEEITISINQDAFDPATADSISPDNTDMRDITSLELSKLMGLGWNVGNSLESINSSNGSFTGGETSWGNPKISQQLIDSVKSAGFNAIRIPVSYSNHLEDQTNYTIKEAWLQRVEEVVNYVLSKDMYAIINIHWDGGWLDDPTYESQSEINTKLSALWKQIAVYFRNYNDYLLFAGTNEVHVDGYYGTPTTENIKVQNSFNQTFVDAVRGTGGRNTYRHLIVQSYYTNISYACGYMEMPEDDTEDRLFTEVHFYDPYDFALQTDDGYKTQWGQNFVGRDVSSWGQEDWVNEAFENMKANFVDNGIPVILGEFGAILRSSLSSGLEEHIQSRLYYLKYVTNAAVENELIPFYWDNGDAGNNGFALFDRSDGTPIDPDAIQAIINYSE